MLDLDTETTCHCGGAYNGSDHCPDCLCEQYESDCGRRPFPKLLDSVLWQADQSWHFRAIYALEDGTKVQLRIRRNAYDAQSYATADRWDGTKWQHVCALAPPQMHVLAKQDNGVPVISYGGKDLNTKQYQAFATDGTQLLDLVAKVLY